MIDHLLNNLAVPFNKKTKLDTCLTDTHYGKKTITHAELLIPLTDIT